MKKELRWLGGVLCAGCLVSGSTAFSQATEVCTTQSQMQVEMRNVLSSAATSLATMVESANQDGVRASTIAEFRTDFSGIGSTVASTAPKLKGASPEIEQIYLLDASALKATNGTNPDAQFYCVLNKSASAATFTIPQLPPGKYAFAMVRMESVTPWRLSFLLRQDGGKWLLAGFYPMPLTSGGHDGLWYWKQARTYTAQKQTWASWLYLQEAQSLVLPAAFVSSTHLDLLQNELQAAAPPAIGGGMSADAPMVIRAANGSEFRFTGLSVNDSVSFDIAAHIKVDSLEDANAARKRNEDAAAALVNAHPELKSAFHGVWVFADAPGKNPYATLIAMTELK